MHNLIHVRFMYSKFYWLAGGASVTILTRQIIFILLLAVIFGIVYVASMIIESIEAKRPLPSGIHPVKPKPSSNTAAVKTKQVDVLAIALANAKAKTDAQVEYKRKKEELEREIQDAMQLYDSFETLLKLIEQAEYDIADAEYYLKANIYKPTGYYKRQMDSLPETKVILSELLRHKEILKGRI